MAALTAPGKQTLPPHATPLAAFGEALHFLPHHTKPFRRRHLLLLAISLLFVGTMILELSVVITRRSLDPRLLFNGAAAPTPVKVLTEVSSSNGFAFKYDPDLFTSQALGMNQNQTYSESELKKGEALAQVTLTPLPSRVPAAEAAAELDVRVEVDDAAFATYKAAAPPRTDITRLVADYFAPKPTNIATISEESRTTDSINGTLMTKTTYVVAPKFAGNPTRTIVWAAEIKGKPLAITIKGIVAGGAVPTSMAAVMKSMQIDSDKKVEGVFDIFKPEQAPAIDQKYVSDQISPAVVKIYHIVCGSLVFQQQVISADICSGITGSGFLVSEDGYIATNGHVVVYGAKDMLAQALLANPELLKQFLASSELSTREINEVINRPELTAAVVSKVYDLPSSDLRLINQRERTIVATGSEPVNISNETAIKNAVEKFSNSEKLKQATVIDYDYSAKDQLTLVADPEQGFSASDVALLKIDTDNAPLLHISTDAVTQNQRIMLLGFPSDADNELTDNSRLALSVTNGNINSIRDAAGDDAKLYQSDADASHGSSGGPAVDENGRVLGLLTYRFESDEKGDAAKSYIRDIADFNSLVKGKNIHLNTTSSTQDAWEKGLGYYSKQQYSLALAQFQKVGRDYPSHRLAGMYIEISKQAIYSGKNVSEPPVALIMAGVVIGTGLAVFAATLMFRHFGHHRVYRAYHQHRVAVGHK